MRMLAAAAVLVSAAVHLYLWFDVFRHTDVVGPAFMLNAVGGTVIAILLVTWRHWVPLVLAVGFGASTLGAFLIAVTVGLFGVHEHWTGARGETGQSFNFYDRDDGAWHQVWVSSNGNVLNLTGHYSHGTLTYAGENRKPDGTVLHHRLSFHANPDGTVRQLWETSSDGGSTWATSFDGLYAKRKG